MTGNLLANSGLPEEVVIARAVREGFRVKRYHTEELISEETVGEHTAGVLALCLVLTDGQASRNLLIQALFHDLAERRTGDVPYPVKRDNPDLKSLLVNLEEAYLEEIFPPLPTISLEDELLLKAADMLQLCYKARAEINMGNNLARSILSNGVRYLATVKLGGAAAHRLINLLKDVGSDEEYR